MSSIIMNPITEVRAETGRDSWRVSLHGGHSAAFCDHASSPLEDIVVAALGQGFSTYGISEHAPRIETERLFDEEIAMGWTVEMLLDLFERYAAEVDRLKAKYAGRIALLKGFEIEVVPTGTYVETMLGFRARFHFDYIVGSVHYVAGHIIDYKREDFERAVAACGGFEAMAVTYYQDVAAMVRAMRPEVAAHLDLVVKNAPDPAAAETPPVRDAAYAALDAIAECGAILDVNTAGYRKGLGRPYPAPWLVRAASERGIPFCFGDDAHAVAQVGSHFEEARRYLLELGVTEIHSLVPGADGLEKCAVTLI